MLDLLLAAVIFLAAFAASLRAWAWIDALPDGDPIEQQAGTTPEPVEAI